MSKRLLLLVALAACLPAWGQLKLGGADDLLEPEKAFRFSARALDRSTIEVRYEIADGYYLYRERFKFSAEGARLGAPEFPTGIKHKDEFFGEVETYRKEVRIRVPVEGDGRVRLTVVSQGCADVGVCYVPMESEATLQPAALSASALSASPPEAADEPRFSLFASDMDIARLFAGSVPLVLGSFFVLGLLLTFTPCVLPMVPILSGIIAGEGPSLTRPRAAALSGAYVLGMAITYAVAGVLAGLSGAMLSAALQSPWVLGSFAALFVLLAGAMFGFYELQFPAALQTRLAATTNRLPGGRFAGVFAMGALSALIVGPCVAAPLAGALLYISQSRDVVLGGSALFAMALGMGVPLLFEAAGTGLLYWLDPRPAVDARIDIGQMTLYAIAFGFLLVLPLAFGAVIGMAETPAAAPPPPQHILDLRISLRTIVDVHVVRGFVQIACVKIDGDYSALFCDRPDDIVGHVAHNGSDGFRRRM